MIPYTRPILLIKNYSSLYYLLTIRKLIVNSVYYIHNSIFLSLKLHKNNYKYYLLILTF